MEAHSDSPARSRESVMNWLEHEARPAAMYKLMTVRFRCEAWPTLIATVFAYPEVTSNAASGACMKFWPRRVASAARLSGFPAARLKSLPNFCTRSH
jgi:hypothetical protein